MHKKLKRSVSAALICSMLVTSAASALSVTAFADTTISDTASKSYKIETKTVNFYQISAEVKAPAEISFVNGTDIPYMSVSDVMDMLKLINSVNPDYSLEVKVDGGVVTLTRETHYSCIINFDEDYIYFNDYNEFFKKDSDHNLIDPTSIAMKDDDGRLCYIKRGIKGTNERYGSDTFMDLKAYGIDLVQDGENFYIPLQTFNDVFFAPKMISVLYNGKDLFLTPSNGAAFLAADGLSELGKIYYSNKTKKLSKALTKFNYNELCFALDHLYGLKAQHKIDNFDSLFTYTGLKEELLSRNSAKIDAAIYKLITQYLDDQHSSYTMSGYGAGKNLSDKFKKVYGSGISFETSTAIYIDFLKTREKFYPDGVPGYEEIGDTAFITFDSFVNNDTDYYTAAPTSDSKNTIGIISYSVQQILRKGSPIKNVVLDLSCNSGGTLDAAVYTLAAFLGKASLSYEDTLTGALVTGEYFADTNFDHKFNSKDTLAGKGLKLYCLTSDASFSCGNLVPCKFKQSPEVINIGQTSGGGACNVLPLSTATGTLFNTSGNSRISFMKNGSFYDVDQGAVPDFVITDKENFYDREKLAEYLKTLM